MISTDFRWPQINAPPPFHWGPLWTPLGYLTGATEMVFGTLGDFRSIPGNQSHGTECPCSDTLLLPVPLLTREHGGGGEIGR
jgi:hypothetical protein